MWRLRHDYMRQICLKEMNVAKKLGSISENLQIVITCGTFRYQWIRSFARARFVTNFEAERCPKKHFSRSASCTKFAFTGHCGVFSFLECYHFQDKIWIFCSVWGAVRESLHFASVTDTEPTILQISACEYIFYFQFGPYRPIAHRLALAWSSHLSISESVNQSMTTIRTLYCTILLYILHHVVYHQIGNPLIGKNLSLDRDEKYSHIISGELARSSSFSAAVP